MARAVLVAVSALGLLLFGSPRIALAEEQPDYGSISGYVTAGGAPVSAHVCLDSWDCTYSDSADGSYSFDTVDRSSTYRVSAEVSGFLRTYYATTGGVLTAAAATPVDLGTSADATGIDIELIKGATVSGTVSVSSGPVDDAQVCVKGTSDPCTYTDSEGHYQLQVSPGTRVLKASKDYSDTTITGLSASLTLADEQVVTDADIALAEGTGLSGTVTGPVVGAYPEVRAYQVVDGVEHFVDSTGTYDSGQYAFRNLPAGNYHVRYRSAAYLDACYGGSSCATVSVIGGKLTALGAVELVVKSPGSLSGVVVGEGTTPVAGVTVTAKGNLHSYTTTTDAHGAYRFDSLASGIRWDLEATKDGYTSDEEYRTPRPDATVSVPNMRIVALGSVTVTLTGDGGAPVEGLRIGLDVTDDYSSDHSGVTDAVGTYTFTGLAPGHYRVSAEAGNGYLGAYYPGVASDSDATPVALPAGGSRAVTLALHKPSSISGTVTGAAGSLLSGWAQLYKDDDSDSIHGIEITNGAYTFEGLPAGRYTVHFQVDGYRPAWLGGSAKESGASWIDVDVAEASAGHDIQLTRIPSGTVTIAIPDSPVDLSALTVRLVSQAGAVYDAQAGESGDFVLTPEAGSYSVEVDGSYGMICGPDAVATCATEAITVVDGGTASRQVTLPELGSVSGTATLANSNEGWVSLIDANGQRVAETDPEESGPYLIRQVPLGDYTIELEEWDDTSDEPVYSGTIHVDGDVTKDLVAVASTHSISGQVTLTTSEAGEESWVRLLAVDKATNKVAASDWLDSLSAGQHPYRLSGLPEGSYLIGMKATFGREVWFDDAASPDAATPVAMNGADVSAINLTLPAKSNLVTLTVHLQLPAGLDLADYEPGVVLRDDEGQLYFSATCDGCYEFVVPKGHYQIAVDRSSGLNTASVSQDVDLTGDRSIDIQVPQGARLSGRLVDADGVGVSGEVSISLGDDDSAGAETDTWGYWRIGGLPAGSVEVQAHAYEMPLATASAGYTVVAGQTLDVGDMVLGQGGRLRVVVPEMDDDAPAVRVSITTLDGTLLDTDRVWPGSDELFSGLPVGKVLVHFEGRGIVPGWWQGAASADEATPVTIAAWTTTTIRPEFTPATVPGGTISGTLANATGKSGTYSVLLFDQYGDFTEVDVAADGSYSASVAPGSYRVRASLCVGYWMGESDCMGSRVLSWYGGSSKATATEVEVKSSATTSGIDVAIGAAPPFTTTPKPTIDGTATVGGRLTATAGAWAPEPNSLSYQWFRDGSRIDRATEASYTVASDDFDHELTVTVTGTRTGLSPVSVTSLATAKVQKGTISTGSVAISGTPSLGSVLTASATGWGPAGVAIGYQWNRDGAAIGGATAASYQAQAADVGAKLTVTVKATLAGFTDVTRTSSPTVAIAAGTLTAPAIVSVTGMAKVGSRLDAQPGSWGPAGVALTYQWLRNGASIPGATSPSYTVTGADGGASLSVRVSGSLAGYATLERTSAATAKVPGQPSAPATPKIAGKAQVGQTLAAKVSGWKPASASFAYQWYRNGAAISGANSASLALTGADKGKKITVKVTGSAPGYSDASATSKATAKVAAGTISPAAVAISGQARFGEVLTATTGNWKPNGVSLTYQWLRSGKSISKATGSTYTLTAADLGRKITVKVTGSAAGYTTASKVSKATGKVQPQAFTAGTPTVSGTAVVGQVLSVDPGSWSPQPSFSYQWLRNGKAISKAKAQTYKLVAADLGKKISVRVTANRAGYATVSKTTAVVSVS